MKTKRLHIRRFQADDLADVFKLISDNDVMRYLEKPYTLERAKQFLYEAGLQEHPLIYAVEDLCGNFIGYVIYHPYDENSYEIGWVLYKKEWQKGYAQELTEALIHDAKNKEKDLVIECVTEQEATKRIALNNHFRFIAHIDNCHIYRLKNT